MASAQVINCACAVPAKLFTVKNTSSANFGREFYTCGNFPKACTSFCYTDDATAMQNKVKNGQIWGKPVPQEGDVQMKPAPTAAAAAGRDPSSDVFDSFNRRVLQIENNLLTIATKLDELNNGQSTILAAVHATK